MPCPTVASRAAIDGELEEVGWVGRDAIQEAIDGGDPGFQLPPPVSIARFLVDRWAARARVTDSLGGIARVGARDPAGR